MPGSGREKKVLFVNLEAMVGGAEQSLLLLAKYLREHFEVAVACPGKSPLASKLETMKIRVFSLPRPTGSFYYKVRQLIHLIRVCFSMIGIIRRFKPDIIHCNSFYAALASLLPAFATRRKIIWHARDMTRFRLAMRICGVLSDRIIAVSNSTAEFLALQGIERCRISVVHNGAEIESNSRRAEKSARSSPFVFANIGQFVPWKNHGLFIEAAELFVRKGGQAEFLLVGSDVFGRDPVFEAAILKRIAGSPIRDKFNVIGWQDDMDSVWHRIDCVVHAARMEPFGRVVIEAMTHEIPVVAVDSGGPGEILDNGRTGILVPAHDAGPLSDAMLELINNRKHSETLAICGKHEVITRFSACQTASRIHEVYRQVLTA